MTRVTTAKLALAGTALLLFVAGVRLENATVRWIGIGFMIGAFALRFWKPRADRDGDPGGTGE